MPSNSGPKIGLPQVAPRSGETRTVRWFWNAAIGRRCGHPERGKDVVQGAVGSREELMVDGEGISTGVVEHASRLPGPAGVGRPAEHRRSPEWEQRRRDLQTLPGGVGQTRFDRVGGNGLLVGLAQRAGLLVEQNRPAPVPAAVERTRDRHGALTAGAVRVGVVERQGCNIEHPTIGRKGRPRIGGAADRPRPWPGSAPAPAWSSSAGRHPG